MCQVPAEPISQLPACATDRLKPRAGVGPYSTVLSPAVSVHQAIVMVLVSASGFSMMGPRVIVTAEARPETTSAAASTRRSSLLSSSLPREAGAGHERMCAAGARDHTPATRGEGRRKAHADA